MSTRALAEVETSSGRIGYILGTFPALTETFILREIGALRRRGVDVIVCAIRRPTAQQRAPVDAIATDGPAFYARPESVLRHLGSNLISFLAHPRRYVAALRAFLREAARQPPREALQLLYHMVAGIGFSRDLRRLGVRHVHCHFNNPTNMALAAHMVEGLPFSFTAHASADLFIRPTLLDEKVASARFVVAVCDYSRAFLDSITGFRHSDKLHRIYNGVEWRDLEEGGQGLDFNAIPSAPPRRQLLSVGSLVGAKGHATLIQVCARLRARGRSFHCRIIGEGPERPILERLIRDHALQDSVELAGACPLDRVYAALSKADIFVLMSEIGRSGLRDGFPTVILEAMAAGLPVVSTSLSGIPEMVQDGVTGILVRERDVEGATEALELLLESADMRRSMGRAGRARVREFFNLEDSVDHLATLLSSNAPPARPGVMPLAS